MHFPEMVQASGVPGGTLYRLALSPDGTAAVYATSLGWPPVAPVEPPGAPEDAPAPTPAK